MSELKRSRKLKAPSLTKEWSSFKVPQDKALKILRCLMPPRILIVHPPLIDGVAWVDPLKKEGFNVLATTELDRIQRAWSATTEAPLIVIGEFKTADPEIFTGSYSFVYLYPNNRIAYQKLVEQTPITEGKSVAELTDALLKAHRELYAAFCQSFDEKILTVLM